MNDARTSSFSDIPLVLADGFPAVYLPHLLLQVNDRETPNPFNTDSAETLPSFHLPFIDASNPLHSFCCSLSTQLNSLVFSLNGKFNKERVAASTKALQLQGRLEGLANDLALTRIEVWFKTYAYTFMDPVLLTANPSLADAKDLLQDLRRHTMIVENSLPPEAHQAWGATTPHILTGGPVSRTLKVFDGFGRAVTFCLPNLAYAKLLYPTITQVLLDVEQEAVLSLASKDVPFHSYSFRMYAKSESSVPKSEKVL